MNDKTCQTCNSERILDFSARHKDTFWMSINGKQYEGYNQGDIGLGWGGDESEGSLCLNCGQLQGTWPLKYSEIELEE